MNFSNWCPRFSQIDCFKAFIFNWITQNPLVAIAEHTWLAKVSLGSKIRPWVAHFLNGKPFKSVSAVGNIGGDFKFPFTWRLKVMSLSDIHTFLMSPNSVAKALGISRSSVYALMRNGDLPWVQFGADRRIHIKEVERLSIEGIPSTKQRVQSC